MINKIMSRFNLWIIRIFPRPFEDFAVKGNNLIGVEIGVYEGEHANSLLRNLNIKKLYLIDPYDLYGEYKEGKKHLRDSLFVAEKIMKRKLSKYGDKTVFIKKMSSNALKDIPDNLDFVYIDGNHEYKFVKEDIENYYPKLKVKGVIGGHDFDNGGCSEHMGVTNAVLEFCSNNNLQLYCDNRDWWIYKK